MATLPKFQHLITLGVVPDTVQLLRCTLCGGVVADRAGMDQHERWHAAVEYVGTCTDPAWRV